MSQAAAIAEKAGGVSLEQDGAVALLTLNEPQRRNAMSAAIREQLAQHLRTGMADPAVRARVTAMR